MKLHHNNCSLRNLLFSDIFARKPSEGAARCSLTMRYNGRICYVVKTILCILETTNSACISTLLCMDLFGVLRKRYGSQEFLTHQACFYPFRLFHQPTTILCNNGFPIMTSLVAIAALPWSKLMTLRIHGIIRYCVVTLRKSFAHKISYEPNFKFTRLSSSIHSLRLFLLVGL